MRFPSRCGLLLLAFIGLTTCVTRWNEPAGEENLSDLAIRQLQPSDEAFSALRNADEAKDRIPIGSLILVMAGVGALAVHPPKLLRRSCRSVLAKGIAFKIKGVRR